MLPSPFAIGPDDATDFTTPAGRTVAVMGRSH